MEAAQSPAAGRGGDLRGRAAPACRRRHLILAVVCCLSVSLSLAQAAPRSAAAVPQAGAASARKGTAEPAKAPPQTPRQFSESLLPILRHARTPFLCYSSYIGIVEGYAERTAAVRTGNTQADAFQGKVAAHLRQMAGVLTQMAEQARVREEIRFGRTAVPRGLQQKTYAEAGAEHRRLLGEFARMTSMLPQTVAAARR